MPKKDIVERILITNLEYPNKGIGAFNEKKVTVNNALPGQTLEVSLKKRRGEYKGRLLSVIEKSPMEIEPTCVHFGLCGGCNYKNLPYEKELELKEEMVLNMFKKADIEGFTYDGMVSAPSPCGYRNKMEFSFGDEEKGGKLALGMRKRNSYYEVVTSEHCNIIDNDFRAVLLTVLAFFSAKVETFYHKLTHNGTLRHLIVRKGFFTGEILVNLVTTSAINIDLTPLVSSLTALSTDGKIVSVLHTLNDSVADVVICDNMTVLHGRDYFYDELLGLKFKISPFSFFQTNSAGAEKLYDTVRQYVGDIYDKTILDLYCGTGTIAQIVSKNAKKVIGVELVEEAVFAARINAALNDIHNCEFIAGDVFKVLEDLNGNYDLAILDPPRDGLHPKALKKILEFDIKKIVYVSCKPSSLVRDLAAFVEAGYVLEGMKIHDMFPGTGHVECVVGMSRVGGSIE